MYLKFCAQVTLFTNIFLSIVKIKLALDYCADTTCPKQGLHIRCGNDGSFSENCTGQYHLEDMSPYIDLILNEHNSYRNWIAGGKLECFYPAKMMPILNWDWELAENAEFNAKTCTFAHDKCRSTSKFKYAGQNIYYTRTKDLKITIEKFIQEAIFLWFEEYLDADYNLIEAFRKTEPQTGHFTTLVNDRQDHVGCACLNNIQNTIPRKRMIIFVCNYSSTNIKGRPTYKTGAPASACQRTNIKYEYLCEDEIDPNDVS